MRRLSLQPRIGPPSASGALVASGGTPPIGAVPPPGAHGGDADAVARALGVDPTEILDLSSSLNPDAPAIAELAGKHLDALRRYPDPRAATEAVAGALGAPPDEVLLTNGGSEAIALVCAELGRAAVAAPEFSLYARHLRERVDPLDDPGAPLVASNPNNPTGRLAAPDCHASVWDEAFYPLATGRWTRGDHQRRGTTVIGSLTKVFTCPGLRIGYVVGEPGLVERLAERQPRWSVNALAASLVPDLLERADLATWRDAIAERRRALEATIPGVLPSDAPYVLAEAPGGGVATRARLARRGVLVRDCATFGLPAFVRIAVPDEAGLRRLAEAWMHEERDPETIR